MQNLTAKDIMQDSEKLQFLTLDATYADAKAFSRSGRFSNYSFPLVENKGNLIIIFLFTFITYSFK